MKNKGDKTMKKVLLTSAVALAAFGAVQAVSADSQAQYSNGVVHERLTNTNQLLQNKPIR